jgi:hypothetical protein
MPVPGYLTQRQVMELLDRSYDTVRRWRANGELPNSRVGDGGVVEVAVADLVASGHLDAARAADLADAVDKGAGPSPGTRPDVEVLSAQLDATRQLLAEARDEVTFLRQVVSGLVAGRSGPQPEGRPV